MAYSYQGTLSVSSYQGTLSASDDGSSGLFGELNYGVQPLSQTPTSDYNTLTNKPRINNVELVGNITTERLGIRNGEDGFSPVITERETELGYNITITDVEGSNTITLKNGTNGLNGTNGQDGKSAYDIAVEQGFVGTEDEWLESLKGQDGIVMDAPSDGKVYGRMNANWVEATVTVDNILSTTSENPVQNKVITKELNKKADQTTVDSALSLKANSADVTASLAGKSDTGHTHDDRYYTESEINTKLNTKLNTSLKGTASGLAELDPNGKVPSSQLPSYVDDVLEYDKLASFPSTGETGKIYLDTTTNKTYRWSGSEYVEISASLALGETSSTAYRGDRGKVAYDHSQTAHAPSNAEANVQSDWSVTDTASDAYIKNKPTTLPADGGNADTLDGLHASDIQIDSVSDTAELVTLDNLQGGVPFSEIVLGGSIVGQEITLAVSGKNMLPKPNWEGSVKTSNGVTFSVAENGTITISGTTTGNATVHLMTTRMRVTKPLTLSSNGTLSGIALIFRLTKDGEAMYRTVYGKSVIEAGVIIEDIYLQQQKSGVEVSGEISPQLESGESATAYEPYHGSSVTVTPDSNPYTVPNDIRQQDGINNVSVSAGEVKVTGVKHNAAFEAVYKRGVPADGGNADTVDSKHASDFSQIINLGNTSTDTKTAIGIQGKTTTYWCSSWTDYPSNLPSGQGTILAINYKGSGTAGSDQVWTTQIYISASSSFANPRIYFRTTKKDSVNAWRDIADGGNAASVGTYTEAKIAALEARIAALETKG